MRFHLYKFWKQLMGSFWFLPALMVASAIILAFTTLYIDRLDFDFSVPELSWIYSGSPDGARSILSTIASSMISVAGLTFSITIVALSLASSQLGPRLLNNFMRDSANQIVLGTFISVFTYCLLILRSIRSLDEISFVPHISLTLAIVLALISLGVLIYFFNHISMMIQAQNLVVKIGDEMKSDIEHLLSDEHTPYEHELRSEDGIPDNFEQESTYITANTSGLLQAVDYEGLVELCADNDFMVKVLHRPGDFVSYHSNIMSVYAPHGSVSDEIKDKIQDTFTMGAIQLRLQDIEFSVDQLVEVAVRALSPGINDPFTAIACLNQFSANLSMLAKQDLPSGYYYDADGQLRVISKVVKFKDIVAAAFNQIRQHGKNDVAVTIRLLEVIAAILAQTTTDEQRQALIDQANTIKQTSERVIEEELDLKDIMQRYDEIMKIHDEVRYSH